MIACRVPLTLSGLAFTILLLAASSAGAGVRVMQVARRPGKTGAGGSSGPLRIYGARNGVFSGQVVAPAGTTARAPKLKGPGAIPASAIQVRYAHADGTSRSRKSRGFFDGLHPAPAAGTGMQPIWLTVKVPADAKPGKYTGAWSVGGSSVKVELDVADFRLPDARDWLTHAGFIQSPDSVAMHYKVTMWSAEHWKLLDKTFKLLGEVGTKTLYIPLIRRTHFGNPHGMVYWVKKGDKLEPDFSIVEKYVALAVKHLGKIPIVCMVCWETKDSGGKKHWGKYPKNDRDILITVKNGGKLEEATGPEWNTPECKAFWKPVFAGVKKILDKHGIGDSMTLGIGGDFQPTKEAVADLSAAAPGVKWVAHSHVRWTNVHGVPTAVSAAVWGIHGIRNPSDKLKWKWQKSRYYGWKKEWRLLAFPRGGCPVYGGALTPASSLGMWRSLAEAAIVSKGQPKHSPGCRGFDRLGADFWPVLKDKRGRASPMCARYPETQWGQLRISYASATLLAPGKDGAVHTMRSENVREGQQETEARIFIEKALLAKKISGALATRVQKLLDDRVRGFVKATVGQRGGKSKRVNRWEQWSAGDWHKKSGELFAAAAEVAGKLGTGR